MAASTARWLIARLPNFRQIHPELAAVVAADQRRLRKAGSVANELGHEVVVLPIEATVRGLVWTEAKEGRASEQLWFRPARRPPVGAVAQPSRVNCMIQLVSQSVPWL